MSTNVVNCILGEWDLQAIIFGKNGKSAQPDKIGGRGCTGLSIYLKGDSDKSYFISMKV